MSSNKIIKIKNKKKKTKIVCLTAYSKNIAKILDNQCDIVLVGDSMANVLYGMKNTNEILLETIIKHAKAVRLGLNKSLMVVDMPAKTYRSTSEAKKNAKLIIKKTRCDAVKIESNKMNFKIIKALVKANIPVMGHIGFTPQFKKRFKIFGKTSLEKKKLLNEAILIEKAGAFSLVLECVTESAARLITNKIKVPTIGIGSSSSCDGQILVTDDIIGLSGFYPRFVKKYLNLNKLILKAVRKYKQDVKKQYFPLKKHTY